LGTRFPKDAWNNHWLLDNNATVVPEEIVFLEERLRAVQKKIGDVPEMQKVLTEQWRQRSLFAHQTKKRPMPVDPLQLIQVAVKQRAVDKSRPRGHEVSQ